MPGTLSTHLRNLPLDEPCCHVKNLVTVESDEFSFLLSDVDLDAKGFEIWLSVCSSTLERPAVESAEFWLSLGVGSDDGRSARSFLACG